jgi:hypothetical protein
LLKVALARRAALEVRRALMAVHKARYGFSSAGRRSDELQSELNCGTSMPSPMRKKGLAASPNWVKLRKVKMGLMKFKARARRLSF